MARARNVKPALFENEELAELPMGDRLLFVGLWTVADRAGRLEDRVKRIKAQLFPYDDLDVDAALNRLSAAGFIQRYSGDGQGLIQVVNFQRHQNPHKNEAPSQLPGPQGWVEATPNEHQSDSVQAPESHQSNPVQIPNEHQSDSSSCAPTDSGFPQPDSLNRIPSSERASARSGARDLGDEADPVPTAPAPVELTDDPPPPAPTPIRPRQAKTPVKTLIPDDFDLTAERRTYATSNGIAPNRVASTWSAFVNHHEAHASRFADWDAAWRTWVGREPQFDRTRGSPTATQHRRSASGTVL